jgi:hypothetical protein
MPSLAITKQMNLADPPSSKVALSGSVIPFRVEFKRGCKPNIPRHNCIKSLIMRKPSSI